MNYIDLIILVAVALFAYMGYLRGFIRDTLDLLALLIAIAMAILFYTKVGGWLSGWTSLSAGLSGTVAFFLIWFASMFVYYAIMTFTFEYIPEAARHSDTNKYLGVLPGLVRVVLFAWFSINLLFILAISGPAKEVINGSFGARQMTKSNATVNEFLNRTFGPVALDTAGFLTVMPQSNESVQLGFTTTGVKTSNSLAKGMLDLVNEARAGRDLKPLVFDDKLAAVGDAHARDMFAKGYFSHNTPDGKTPFDRMDKAGIHYMIAGENLALAPSTEDAFEGLMDSPGHKANMLSSDFGKVGISAVVSPEYGIIFTQEFTN